MRILLAILLSHRPRFRPRRRVHWTPLSTGVAARLRGVSAVSDRVAWASGTNGTVLKTTDGGTTWARLIVPGAEKLDFRDIDAVDDKTAYVLSIGSGELSRIYKTSDARPHLDRAVRQSRPEGVLRRDGVLGREARRGGQRRGRWSVRHPDDQRRRQVVGARAAGSAAAGAAERRLLRRERYERDRRRAEPRLGRHRRRERSARPALERRRPHVGVGAARRSTPARRRASSRSPSATRRTASWSAETTRPSPP